MEQKKAPLDLGLKMLENYKIVRHNEFRFISSEFGFVNSFIKMEPSLFAFGQPYRIKEGRIALVKQGVARVSTSRKPIINDSHLYYSGHRSLS